MPGYRLINAGAVLAERLDDLADLRRRYAVAGNPTVARTARGNALTLDGTGDYVDLGDPDALSFGDGAADSAFSVSCWIKMDEATTFPVLGKGVYNADAEWRLLVAADDRLHFQTFDESVADCYVGRMTDAVLTGYEGEWVHVCGTYDGGGTSGDFVLYVAGVAVASSASESNPGAYVAMEPQAHAVWLGRDGANDADGAMRDASVWPRVLTPTEVADLAADDAFGRTDRALTSRWDLSTVNPSDLGWRGLGNDGVGTGLVAATDVVDGVAGGKALEFDGTEYVITSFSSFVPRMTYAGWVRLNSLASDSAIWAGSASGTCPMLRIKTDSSVKFWADVGHASVSFDGALVWTLGQWYHWALSFDEDTNDATFYKDGLLHSVKSMVTDYNVAPGTLVIAARDLGTDPLTGAEDEFMVFDSILTPLQVRDLYARSRRGALR